MIPAAGRRGLGQAWPASGGFSSSPPGNIVSQREKLRGEVSKSRNVAQGTALLR